MTRRRKIGLFCVGAAVFLALTGGVIQGNVLAGKYRTGLENGYRRALSDLSSAVSTIGTALQKSEYANTSTQETSLTTLILRESASAKSALAVLPLKDGQLDSVSKFLSQAGDYALMLSHKIAAGNAISDEEHETLRTLSAYAASLSEDLAAAQNYFSDGKTIGETETFLGNLESGEKPSSVEAFETAAEDFSDFPTLLYDGPFSDHIASRKPEYLSGRNDVSRDEARKNAALFSGIPVSGLESAQDTEGSMPLYNFTNGENRVSVSKQGGIVASFSLPHTVSEEKFSPEEAAEIAKDYLLSHGFDCMEYSYYAVSDHLCTVNFAFVQGGVICYPDLIKVSVSLGDGSVTGYNAVGYLMNHTGRDFTAKVLSVAEAQKSVSPALKIEKGRPAVIPTPSFGEVFCYEFTCTGREDEQVLVYINAKTGLEENILLLLSSDQGVLAK